MNNTLDSDDWRSIVVDPSAAGRRVDTYLSLRFPSMSRTEVARQVLAGLIASEDRPLKPASRLRNGECIRIRVPGIGPDGPPPDMPEVIHEDKRLLVVDKPAGLLCHPTGVHFSWGVIGLVRDARPDTRVDLAHRLDRETSGVLVLTKDLDAARLLMTAFQKQEVSKTYYALVRGVPTWSEMTIDAPIGGAPHSDIRIRRGISDSGRAARTDVQVLQRLREHALVECRPHTGRTHQIRVHLDHIGFPLLGDKMYGQPDWVFLHGLDHGSDGLVRKAVGFPRHALHAHSLDLPHPDGGTVHLHAPLPEDMTTIVNGACPRWPEATP